MFLFVYDELLQGSEDHRTFLYGAKYIGNAYTVKEFYMCGSKMKEHCFVTPHPISEIQKSTRIKGEVYEVEYTHIFNLDMHKGHPLFFTRDTIGVECKGKILRVESYLCLDEGRIEFLAETFSRNQVPINKGNWKLFLEKYVNV